MIGSAERPWPSPCPQSCDGETRAMFTMTIHRTRAELATLRGAWDDLVAATGRRNVFLTHAWCSAWCEAFSRDGDLRVLCFHAGRRLVAVVPLVVSRSLGLRTLRFIGSEDADYLGVLALPEDIEPVVAQLLEWVWIVRSAWDVVQFRDIDQDLLELCRSHCPAGVSSVWRMSETCPYVAIDCTWDEFTRRRKERFRRLRQSVNKCLQSGKVEFCYAEDAGLTPDDIEREVDAIQQESWKAAQGRTMFRPEKRAFWRTVLHAMLPADMATCCFMRMDDRPAAFAFGFRFGCKYYYYCTGFRERYRSLSVGSVITQHVLQDAFDRGLREFDMMRGDEAYKELWTTDMRHNYELVLFRSAVSSALPAQVLYKWRWRMRGNPYARRLKIGYRIARERVRHALTCLR